MRYNASKGSGNARKMRSYVLLATGKDQFKEDGDHLGRTLPPRLTTDKTSGMDSRPGAKARARTVNRAHKKRARQSLKRQLTTVTEDLTHAP